VRLKRGKMKKIEIKDFWGEVNAAGIVLAWKGRNVLRVMLRGRGDMRWIWGGFGGKKTPGLASATSKNDWNKGGRVLFNRQL